MNKIRGIIFPPNTVEVNMTFYRGVSEAIRLKDEKISDAQAEQEIQIYLIRHGFNRTMDDQVQDINLSLRASLQKVEVRDWNVSDLSGFLSDDFMSTLISGHFHVALEGSPTSSIRYPVVRAGEVKFVIPQSEHYRRRYNLGTSRAHASIDGIECTIFNNGYVALTIRLLNDSNAPAWDLLQLTKRPDQLIKSSTSCMQEVYDNSAARKPTSLDCGLLNILGYSLAQKLSPVVEACLNNMSLQFADFDQEQWSDRATLDDNATAPWLRWSRPYVGIVVPDDAELSMAIRDEVGPESVQRFVIAAGRTTPEFVDTFVDPAKYLSSDNRNIYGEGGSIVFVASRGWCVWNGGNQNETFFRIGVVEMAHFVVMAVECSNRARRRFFHHVRVQGANRVRALNAALSDMAGSATSLRDLRSNSIRFKKYASLMKRHNRFDILCKAICLRVSAVASSMRCRSNLRREIENASQFVGKAYVAAPFDDGAIILEAQLKTHSARATAARYKGLKSFTQTDESAKGILEHYVSATKSIASYMDSYSSWIAANILIFAVVGVLVTVIGLYLSSR